MTSITFATQLQKWMKKNVLLLILLVLFIFLRIYKIDQLDLWRDEAFSALIAQNNIKTIIEILQDDTMPPLYEILLHIWTRLFGNSELAMRLPSVIFSIITYLYTYALSNLLLKRKDALNIAGIITFSMISIFFAREARAYALMTCTGTASVYYFLKLQKNGSGTDTVKYILTTVLTLYSHNLSLIIPTTQLLYLFIQKKIHRKSTICLRVWMRRFIIIGIMWTPWLLIFINQSQRVGGEFWLTFSPFNSPQETITGLATAVRLFTQEPFSVFDSLLTIITIILIIAGTIKMCNRAKESFTLTIIPFFFWVPLAIMFLISFIRPILYVRYASFVHPFMIILVYQGLTVIRRQSFAMYVVYALVILLSLRIYWYSYIPATDSKPQYRQLSEYIAQHQREEDIILHNNALSYFPYTFYSMKSADSYIFDPEHETPFYVGTALIPAGIYIDSYSTLENAERVWFIHLRTDEDPVTILESHNLTDTIAFPGKLTVQLWTK